MGGIVNVTVVVLLGMNKRMIIT